MKLVHDDERKIPSSFCLIATKETMFEGFLYTHVTIGATHINVRICTHLSGINNNHFNMVDRPYEGTLFLQSNFCTHLFPRRIKGRRDDLRPFICDVLGEIFSCM